MTRRRCRGEPRDDRETQAVDRRAISSRTLIASFSYRGNTASLAAPGAQSGWPASNCGSGLYSTNLDLHGHSCPGPLRLQSSKSGSFLGYSCRVGDQRMMMMARDAGSSSAPALLNLSSLGWIKQSFCNSGACAGKRERLNWDEAIRLLAEALFGVAHVSRGSWQRAAKACV